MTPVTRRSCEDSLGKRPTTRVRRLICELSVSHMSGGASGHEVVALVEGLAEVVDLGFFGGSAQDEVVANEGGLGHQCFLSSVFPWQAETAKTGGDV